MADTVESDETPLPSPDPRKEADPPEKPQEDIRRTVNRAVRHAFKRYSPSVKKEKREDPDEAWVRKAKAARERERATKSSGWVVPLLILAAVAGTYIWGKMRGGVHA